MRMIINICTYLLGERCVPKKKDGMGFINFHCFNLALSSTTCFSLPSPSPSPSWCSSKLIGKLEV
jgi:hypothetical protein